MSLLQRFSIGALLTIGAANLQAAAIPEAAKIGGFAVSCQAWTFNHFGVFEAIEKTAQTGCRAIEFFPGQKLSPDEPGAKFSHSSAEAVIEKVKDHLARHKVTAVNYGVVNARGEAEWRQVFGFAKKLGLYGITTEAVGDLDLLEKLVKEYDITVAIHQHARQPNNANYRVWDPKYVLSVVKDRDHRIGACADTGHWATSGIKPLDGLKLLKGRVMSVHLKERPAVGKEQPDAIYGTGVLDVKSMLDELKRQGFAGNISIEYENNWEHSVPDVAQCVGFIRGYGAVRL